MTLAPPQRAVLAQPFVRLVWPNILPICNRAAQTNSPSGTARRAAKAALRVWKRFYRDELAGSKVSATPLMQYRRPVGGGPSSKT